MPADRRLAGTGFPVHSCVTQSDGLLSTIVEKEKPRLDPRIWDEFERNLRVIDESIAATRARYMAQPADPELAHHMLSAYNRKVELLQELAS